MESEAPGMGRLIALDGSRGQDLRPAANRLLKHALRGKGAGGVSAWDASGIFFELRKGQKSIPQPSPRVLVLLYAADLAFRLRWEIRPALADGMTVVAAPYVESAIAFGDAVGLPHYWLTALFAFAPKPAASYRIKERRENTAWKFKRSEGYLEFCCKTLIAASPAWDAAHLREKFIGYLEAFEQRGGCQVATEKVLAR